MIKKKTDKYMSWKEREELEEKRKKSKGEETSLKDFEK